MEEKQQLEAKHQENEKNEKLELYVQNFNNGDIISNVFPIEFNNGSILTNFEPTCGHCQKKIQEDNIRVHKINGFHSKENNKYEYYNIELYEACLDCHIVNKRQLHVKEAGKGFTVEEMAKGRIIRKMNLEKAYFSKIIAILKKILFPFSK